MQRLKKNNDNNNNNNNDANVLITCYVAGPKPWFSPVPYP